jgi:hypothetical protein
MRSYRIRGPKANMTGMSIRGRKFGHKDTQGEDHIKMETEIEMMDLQAQKCQVLIATTIN